MNKRTRAVVTAALSAALLLNSAPSNAGAIGEVEKVAIGATLGVAAAAALYKARCVAGGGFYSEDSGFHSFDETRRTAFDTFTLVCPVNVMKPPPFRYAGLALELPKDLVLYKSTRKLRAGMRAKGKGENPTGCATHHIVPELDDQGSPGQPSPSDKARSILQRCGIDINDGDNGVFLPNKNDPSEFACKGAHHGRLHNKANAARYYRYVSRAVIEGLSDDGCKGVRNALNRLGEELAESSLDFDFGDAAAGAEPGAGDGAAIQGSAEPSAPQGGLQ